MWAIVSQDKILGRRSEEELNRLIRKRFIIYRAAGEKGEGKVLFTGYYSPIYEGSLEKQGSFKYPLYLIPKDLKVANLGEFDPALEGERIVYRIDSTREEVVPYWSREDIVKGKVLKGQNLEFVYLKDRIDKFYLMTEGSGKIMLANGKSFWVRYSATNGRPYTSLGRTLAEAGKTCGRYAFPPVHQAILPVSSARDGSVSQSK